jgi:glutamyl-tRNA synthetase
MPAVAVPLRVVLLGQPQSPSIDQVLEVMGRERVMERMQSI